MGVGVRVFFVENESRVKRISLKRFQSLIDSGQDVERLPEYAGQRLRIAVVILEVKGRKPVAIERIDRGILEFDGTGRVDRRQEQKQGRLAVGSLSLPMPESSEKSVIDARSRFAKKLIAHEYSWRLTPDVEEAIERSIFVKKAHPLRLV
jgi:hypothetical protein